MSAPFLYEEFLKGNVWHDSLFGQDIRLDDDRYFVSGPEDDHEAVSDLAHKVGYGLPLSDEDRELMLKHQIRFERAAPAAKPLTEVPKIITK